MLIRQAADHIDLDPGCVLYGNVVLATLDTVSVGGYEYVPRAVVVLVVVGIMNLLFVGLFYKELKVSTFDPALATSLGIHASRIHYALMLPRSYYNRCQF